MELCAQALPAPKVILAGRAQFEQGHKNRLSAGARRAAKAACRAGICFIIAHSPPLAYPDFCGRAKANAGAAINKCRGGNFRLLFAAADGIIAFTGPPPNIKSGAPGQNDMRS